MSLRTNYALSSKAFGEITYVKIPPGKGCGFVQFVQRHAAEMAINQMQGYPIGNSRVRLSWGRSQNNSGPAGTPYRPAPPPPVYPSMGMPPTHPYGNFAPLKVSHFQQRILITTLKLIRYPNTVSPKFPSLVCLLCTTTMSSPYRYHVATRTVRSCTISLLP